MDEGDVVGLALRLEGVEIVELRRIARPIRRRSSSPPVATRW